mmetsp:Transcript_72983/g.176100  ORF Transcript_72983/g.176100 Transcript_72983/m.176100 type:complete len:117 (+) Transcript_72983:57-407(+)
MNTHTMATVSRHTRARTHFYVNADTGETYFAVETHRTHAHSYSEGHPLRSGVDGDSRLRGIAPFLAPFATPAPLVKQLVEQLLLLLPQLLLLDEHFLLHAPEGRLCQRARVRSGVL